MHSRKPAAALLGVMACAAVACGSPSPSASPASPDVGTGPAGGATAPAATGIAATAPAPTSTGGAASDDAAAASQCSIAPPALVVGALHLPAGRLTATAEGPVTVCAYAGRYEVLIRYQTGETAAEFAQGKSAQQSLRQAVAAVGGLGDAAYLATDSAGRPPLYTLAARSGDIAVFITAPAAPGAERALMTKLLAKV